MLSESAGLPGLAAAEPPPWLRLPDVRQATDYACGAGALQAVLAYYGIDRRQDVLMAELGTSPQDGTSPRRLVVVARDLGLDPEPVMPMHRDQLIAAIAAGFPVILALQAWITDGDPRDLAGWTRRRDDGHYVVAIGYDDTRLYVEDPAMFGVGFIAFAELEARWHDVDADGTLFEHLGIIVRPGAATGRLPTVLPVD